MAISCTAWCKHGGRCMLPEGHDGLHDASGLCSWPDGESITHVEANAILATKGDSLSQLILTMDEILSALLGEP